MFLAFITGCDKTHGYTYYTLHPAKTRVAYQVCVKNQSAQSSTHCLIVAKAAREIDRRLRAMLEDPKGYGMLILHQQMQLSKYRLALSEVQRQIKQANEQGDSTDMHLLEGQVAGIAEEIETTHYSIDALLAVVRYTFKQTH